MMSEVQVTAVGYNSEPVCKRTLNHLAKLV